MVFREYYLDTQYCPPNDINIQLKLQEEIEFSVLHGKQKL